MKKYYYEVISTFKNCGDEYERGNSTNLKDALSAFYKEKAYKAKNETIEIRRYKYSEYIKDEYIKEMYFSDFDVVSCGYSVVKEI